MAIFQASTSIHAAPPHRMIGNSNGHSSTTEARPAVTTAIMNAKPQAMPSICGTVARKP